MLKSETVLKMTVTGLDARWETTAPLMHNSCNDGVIQLSPLSSYAVLEVIDISQMSFNCIHSLAVFPTHCSQLDLNPANLKATTEAKWILNSFFSFENSIFHRRHNYVIITYCRTSIDGTFTIFQSPGMSRWFLPKIVKSCLNLSKLRPKYYRSFFPDTMYRHETSRDLSATAVLLVTISIHTVLLTLALLCDVVSFIE